jgi:predicted site-specific integrase-resolvase
MAGKQGKCKSRQTVLKYWYNLSATLNPKTPLPGQSFEQLGCDAESLVRGYFYPINFKLMNSTKQSNQQKGIPVIYQRISSEKQDAKKTALIYLRVAADQQTKEKASVTKQKEICLGVVKRQRFICSENADIYMDIGKSGQNTSRPGLNKMLKRCQSDKSVKALIVHDISRLSRDRIDFVIIRQQLKKSGIRLISATEPISDTPEGEMLAGMLSAVAEFYAASEKKHCRCAYN